jgi:hypothetical protein
MSGLMATFVSETQLSDACKSFPRAQWPGLETFSPMPLKNRRSHSMLPGIMFIAGLLGFLGFFLLMAYADMRAYPHNIGGRPAFAWPAFIPIAFELGVLCAMAAGFFGYFVVCRMPKLYVPSDECEGSRRALYDRWLLCISSEDKRKLREARTLLHSLHAEKIEEFE